MPVDIIVPPLSQTMDTLVLLEWMKKPGDSVEKGEVLFTVETDKATLDVESPAKGTVFEVYADPQSEILVRSVIGKILKPGEQTPEETLQKIEESQPQRTEQDTKTKKQGKSSSPQKDTGRTFISPRARRFAAAHHLTIQRNMIEGSGVRGMIVEADLRQYIARQGSEEEEPFQVLPQTNIRRIIAERMMESHHQTAPVTYMVECDVSDLVSFRNKIITDHAADGYKPSFTDLFILAACRTLEDHPNLNARSIDEALQLHRFVHLAIAVDTERGLIVPVLRKADTLSLAQITTNRKALVARALNGSTSPEELSGGTFTISNLGAIGIDTFTPIINPPQVAILALGRIREKPAAHAGGIALRHMLHVGLTCDHRFIDGAPAARFLRGFCDYLENFADPAIHSTIKI